LTYKKTLSILPTFRILRRYETTCSKRCVLEIRHSCCRSVGVLPTAWNRTVILATGKVPAELRALAASRGSAVRIMELLGGVSEVGKGGRGSYARVRGRSLSWNSESGIAALGPSVGVLDREALDKSGILKFG
jgi:hypothetical protein